MIGERTLVYSSTLQPATPFAAPYGIDVAPSGSIYVFDAGNNRVVVFDPNGQQRTEWGGLGDAPGQFDSLGFGSLAVDDGGNVYVVDNGNHRVQKFDGDGGFLVSFGEEGDGEGEFRRAIGIAVGGGEVFVTDDEVPYVQVFDRNGDFLRQFGGRGDVPGTLQHATGIDFDDEGGVYVADYEQKTVQRFDADGQVKGAWRNPGPAGVFQTPEGILVLANGQVLVSSLRDGEIQLLPDQPGEDVEWVVAVDSEEFDDGRLVTPVDLAEAGDGSIYVTDQSADMVWRLERGSG